MLAVATGCSGGRYTISTDRDDAALTHRDLGYSIDRPAWDGSGRWERGEVEGADLAYHDARGTVISLSSSCPNSRATPAVLAHHVTIGTEREGMIDSGPIEVAGIEGWTQTFDAVEDGFELRIKTVTVVSGPCVYDWLLVAGAVETFESIEPAFDSWVGSFVPPREDTTGGESR